MAVYRPTYRNRTTGQLVESPTWWYEFCFAGKRYRESAKTPLKTLAKVAEDQRRRDLEKAYAGQPLEKREDRVRSVQDVVKPYLERYVVNHRPKSIIFARQRLAHVTRLLGNTLLIDLTESAIYDYIRRRLEEKVSGRTVNMELGELSRAIGKSWSVLWPRVRKLEERQDAGRALSAEEERRLLDATVTAHSPLIPVFVRVALLSAMRAGEITTLTWSQVDLINRVIRVGRAKTSSGTGREIPMNEALFQILSAHADWFHARFGRAKPEHYLFPSGKPRPTDPTRHITDVSGAWDALRRAAGVSCRLHDLRHTSLTKLAEAGVPESTMLSLAGHMSRRMVEHYSHVRMKAKRAAVEALTEPPEAETSMLVPKAIPKAAVSSRIQ